MNSRILALVLATATTLITSGCSDYLLGDILKPETDTAEREGGDEYHQPGEGIEANGCDDIVITDSEGQRHQVRSYLTFELDYPTQRTIVSYDSPNLLEVMLFAHCGDVAFRAGNFYMVGEDHRNSGWMNHANDTSSAIIASGEGGDPIFYGQPYGDTQTLVGVTNQGLWWPLEYEEPIVIESGETAQLTLNVWFWDDSGFVPAPQDKIQASFEGRVSWYGLEAPEDYPEDLPIPPVVGEPIRYVP